MRIRSQDTVMVISGNDKGKRGRVLSVDREAGTLVIEGVHRITRHMRRSQRNPQGGGRLQKEAPIRLDKVMLVCPGCARPTRVGRIPNAEGKRVRVCRRCKTELG
ncbi:MAG: 50S ribosomal protein L24 [Planctomycetes bacterium]|nr:50S ribosomal protein L24 [Planctomycetota bacterium]